MKFQVAQRQQKKLLQQEPKNSKKTKGAGKNPLKMNGEASSLEKIGEESSASSSMNSIEEESKTDPASLTFQGMLCNGVCLDLGLFNLISI